MHTPRMNYRQAASLTEAVMSAVTGNPQEEINEESTSTQLPPPVRDTLEAGKPKPGNPTNRRSAFRGTQNEIEIMMQAYIDYPDFDFAEYYQSSDGQLMLRQLDYNGDGNIDFADLQILLSLEGGDLPFMTADQYIKYMASDARSGAKQQKAGSQMQIGTKKGSLTSRPPAAPPATGTTAK